MAMINGAGGRLGHGHGAALRYPYRLRKTRLIGYHNAGQIIENGGSYYLPKMVGLGRALEFAYTGELNAERAYQWGLLNHLVASEKLEETTRELCARMMGIPPLVQWISKRIMRTRAGYDARKHDGDDLERRRHPARLRRRQGGAPRLHGKAQGRVQGSVMLPSPAPRERVDRRGKRRDG